MIGSRSGPERLLDIVERRSEIEAEFDELLEYFHRTLLGFESSSLDTAQALAYLLESHRSKNPSDWRSSFEAVLADLEKAPARLAITRLGLQTSRQLAIAYRDELEEIGSSGSQETAGLSTAVALAEKSIRNFERFLSEGRRMSPSGVPERYLPDWFFVSDLGFG